MTTRTRKHTAIAWLAGLQVPAHWQETKVKYLANELRAGETITGEAIQEEGSYPVYGGNGLRGYSDSTTHSGTYVLIGRQGALCGNVHVVSGDFWASEHAIVAEAAQDVDHRWLAYLLRVMDLGQYSQTVAQPGIGTAQVKAVPAPVPPIAEQRAIANFLAGETAQIDTLIEEQQRLIGMLVERRVAAVATALDSLGARQTRLKHLASVQSGVTLSGEGDPDDPEWPYLRVANVQAGHVDLTEVKMLRLPAIQAEAAMLRPGDILMTEGGDIDKLGRGAVWHGSIPDMIHQNHIFAVRPSRQLEGRFLEYWLDGPTARLYFRTTAKKTTNLAAINKWILGNLPIALPTISEQLRIADALDAQTATIDLLIAETERFIELSQERRSALITAAVTGQIDVRGKVA